VLTLPKHDLMISKPYKVLWFTNTPSLAASHLNIPIIGGGWINSLEEKINQSGKINLAVAFKNGETELKKFTIAQNTYYAIPDNRTKINKLIARQLGKTDDEKLISYCLKIVSDFKPDVINIFGTEDGFGLIIDKIKIPVVIHLQGILTVYELKWFSAKISRKDLLRHSGLKNLVKAETLIHEYNNFKKAAEREQKIFKLCKYFMGRTDWDKRITSVLSPASQYFCSNEILRKEFYLNSWNKKPEAKKTFISTIQANIYKGLETILQTAILLKNLDEFNFSWVVAGISGQDEIVKIFEQKVGIKFKDANIILAGKLSVLELINTELESDLFIHPSHIDNSPNSICEAMLLGMPVLATNTGGTASLLTDKKEGVLIQDGDPYSMSGAILEIIKDYTFSSELGKNARLKAMKRHDPDDIVNNIFAIYTEVLKQNVIHEQ